MHELIDKIKLEKQLRINMKQ